MYRTLSEYRPEGHDERNLFLVPGTTVGTSVRKLLCGIAKQVAARIHTDGTIDGSSDDKAGGAGTTVMPMPQPKHKVLPQGDIALSASQSAKLSTDLAARP